MKKMIEEGYRDAETLEAPDRRGCEAWLAKPALLERDANAEYAAVLEIDLAEIREPILACPNDPDDVKLLSEVAGDRIDEVFIGSCMTNIGHFRAAGRIFDKAPAIPGTRIWMTPPTKMDETQLMKEGYYAIFIPGRGARRDPRLLALHGQPGPGPARGDDHLDLDPELRRPDGRRGPGLPRLGRAGRRGRPQGRAALGRRSTSPS